MIIVLDYRNTLYLMLFWVPPQVQPKAPLLQILRVAGAQEEVFTLKEVSCEEKMSSVFISMQILFLACNTVYPEEWVISGVNKP